MVLTVLQKTLLKILGIISAIIILFAIGTITYHNLEGWNGVDSFYFTGMTLTTIGYGDLHPTTEASKIFTVFFSLAGIGIVFLTLTVIAQHFLHQQRLLHKRINKITSDIKNEIKTKRQQKGTRRRKGV